ncbi:O-antigen polymerase [Paenibacillus gansuensis]|uniref:O-antigen polymerase n=1 Tax=Paenibacillus gansuensis TaxID=306542 RepID=A0ABW5P7U3_9BACL
MNKRVLHDVKVWWFNPAILLGLIGTIIITGAAAIPAQNYYMYYRVTKYITLGNVMYMIMPLLCFLTGCLLVFQLFRPLKKNAGFYTEFESNAGLYRKAIFVLFFLTVTGYALWMLSLIRNGATPATFLNVLAGKQNAIFEIKHNFLTKVSGVTSLTNFGVPFMILSMYFSYLYKDKTVRRMMAVIALLAVFRAIFFAERLAILELLVPSIVIYVVMRLRDGKRIPLIGMFPAIGFAFVVVLFGIGEYFRSWVNYYMYVYPSYFDFITTRFFGYYVNALNTGMLYFEHLGAGSNPFPFFTLNWFWEFPLISGKYAQLFGTDPDANVLNVLTTMGNPEYNNPSGIMLPYQDFGLVGTATFWLLLGALTGTAYTLFRKGYMLGAMLYPIWFLGLTELPRYVYFTTGRFFPAWISFFGILAIVAFRKRFAATPYKSRVGERTFYENYNHERLHVVQQR